MSKKKKKNRARVRKNRVYTPPITACNRHHICFQRRYWDKGYAKLIRETFVRYVPIVHHNELHRHLTNVPLPDEELLKEAWLKYKEEQEKVDSYGVARAAAWLYVNIPDPEFRKAMQFQVDFFATRNLP